MYSAFAPHQPSESDYGGEGSGSGNIIPWYSQPSPSSGYGLSSQDQDGLTYETYLPQADGAVNATISPTPSGRLAGEPAYCAGRHCCQWTVNGCLCNNHYPSAEDLDRHVARDHAGKQCNSQPSGDYHCHWAGCSKSDSFGNKPKLTRHVHSHTGYKPHQCRFPGCEKGFVTKEQLKNHETTHTRTREHICPQCGKGFAVKTALTSHMNVHKGAKPYICDECGKGFADSSNLSKHKAIHKRTGLKKSHTRRQSLKDPWTTTTTTTVAAPSLSPNSLTPANLAYHSSFTPDAPAQSIESALQAYCVVPCFDTQCTDTDRMPCRSASPCKSAPCSDRACSPSCIEPCNLAHCDAAAAEECQHALPLCDADDCFQHCDFAGCGPDCGLLDCGLQHCLPQDYCAMHACHREADTLCTSTDDSTTPPDLSAFPSHLPGIAAQPAMGGFGTIDRNFDTRVGTGSGVGLDGGDDGGLSEGFKHLRDYIHDDFSGGCMGR